MNTKRILIWSVFVLLVILIIWGMIIANKKAKIENLEIASIDKISDEDWIKGSATSTNVLIEYSDFQCPACAAYFPLVEQLIKENSDKVTFVYRHFPLAQNHANAVSAAKASEAAGKQGKFWEMYEVLFTKQKDWESVKNSKEVFVGYAVDLGLDKDMFVLDYESEAVKDKVNRDYKSGVKANVLGTPTFYLNGKKIDNPRTYEEFKKFIDESSTNTKNI